MACMPKGAAKKGKKKGGKKCGGKKKPCQHIIILIVLNKPLNNAEQVETLCLSSLSKTQRIIELVWPGTLNCAHRGVDQNTSMIIIQVTYYLSVKSATAVKNTSLIMLRKPQRSEAHTLPQFNQLKRIPGKDELLGAIPAGSSNKKNSSFCKLLIIK